MIANTLGSQQSLVNALWPTKSDDNTQTIIRFTVLCIIGAFLLAISAKIRIHIGPVPITLQTFTIMALGAAYGMRLGLATVLIYLGIGALGMDVFTGSSATSYGLEYMRGTTGGYLAGFIIAIGLVGYFAERGSDQSLLKLLIVMLVADTIIFALGIVWLGYVLGWDEPILAHGFYPHIWGDLVKIALAASLISATRHWLNFKN